MYIYYIYIYIYVCMYTLFKEITNNISIKIFQLLTLPDTAIYILSSADCSIFRASIFGIEEIFLYTTSRFMLLHSSGIHTLYMI